MRCINYKTLVLFGNGNEIRKFFWKDCATGGEAFLRTIRYLYRIIIPADFEVFKRRSKRRGESGC